MKTKVTLSMDKEFVEEAKKFAKKNNHSLSQEVSISLSDRMKRSDLAKQKKMEAIRRLAGSINLPDELANKSWDELRYDALKEKYDLD